MGDVGRKLGLPDPKTWKSIRRAGLVRFVAVRGIGVIGLPIALFMTWMNRSATSVATHAVLYGLIVGYLLWRGGEAHYAEYQKEIAAARAKMKPAATAAR